MGEEAPTRQFKERPPRSPAATMTMSPDDLEATIAGAVASVITRQRAEDSASKAAREVEVDERFEKRIKRLKLILGAVVAVAAVLGIVFGVFDWYAGREVEAAVEARRRMDIEGALETVKVAHGTDQTANARTHGVLEDQIKNVGVLQLEQGNDTRGLLLQLAPESKREELREKTPALKAAESAVRAQ